MAPLRSAAMAMLTALLAAVPCASCSTERPETSAGASFPATPSLLDRVARDPLMVLWVSTPDPVAAHDLLVDLGRSLAEVRAPGGAAKFDRERATAVDSLGEPIRELLSKCGPELALVVDVAAVDELMGLALAGSPDVVSRALARSGAIVESDSPAALETALRAMLRRASARLTSDGEGPSARLPVPGALVEAIPDLPRGEITLHWGSTGSVLAIGFDRGWVQRSLDGRPDGERLRDGDDFTRVFPRIEEEPTALTYLNLPRLRGIVNGSTLIQMALANAPEWKRMWDVVGRRLELDRGLGQISARVDGRTVQTTNAPAWMPATAEAIGLLATLAVPDALAAADYTRQLGTVGDMREIGAAIEAYGLDHNAYPVTRDIDRLRTLLEPDYISRMPTRDHWGRRLRVVSDRSEYAICSGGKNGGDCDLVDGGGATRDVDDAIVFRNGAFIQWPERVTEEAARAGG